MWMIGCCWCCCCFFYCCYCHCYCRCCGRCRCHDNRFRYWSHSHDGTPRTHMMLSRQRQRRCLKKRTNLTAAEQQPQKTRRMHRTQHADDSNFDLQQQSEAGRHDLNPWHAAGPTMVTVAGVTKTTTMMMMMMTVSPMQAEHRRGAGRVHRVAPLDWVLLKRLQMAVMARSWRWTTMALGRGRMAVRPFAAVVWLGPWPLTVVCLMWVMWRR
jgi:hypothetical protein